MAEENTSNPTRRLAPSFRPKLSVGPSIDVTSNYRVQTEPAENGIDLDTPYRSIISASELPFYVQAAEETMPTSRVKVLAKSGENYGQYLEGDFDVKVGKGEVYIEIPRDKGLEDWEPFWNRVNKLNGAAKK